MAVTSTDNFDRSDGYSKVNLRDGAQFWAQDANLQSSLNKDQRGLLSAGISGYQLALFDAAGNIFKWGISATTIPVANIRVSEGVFNGDGNGVYTFEMVDATHFRYKYNNDAWSASYVCTADGNTWDIDAGSSGFDVVFASGMAPLDTCTLVVSKALRMLGGEIFYNGVANAVCMAKGLWQIEGQAVELPRTDITGIADGEYIYLAVTQSEVLYTTDPDLAHRGADGNVHFLSPSATKPVYTVSHGLLATIPDETSAQKIIILAKAHNTATVITPDQIWPEPYDLQKVMRDTNPNWGYKVPATPSGLAATNGYEEDDNEGVLRGLESKSYVRLECTASTEGNLSHYEFSVEFNTDAGGVGPLTRYSFHQVPWESGITPYFTLHDVKTNSYLTLRVRLVDRLGVASPWSAAVNYSVGVTCAVTDPVSYSLEKDCQRGTLQDTSNGFWIKNISFGAGAQTDLLGVAIYVKEGSDPGTDIDYFSKASIFAMDTPVSSVAIFVPWHGDHPYVAVCPIDKQGVRGTAVKSDIDLTESLIVSGAFAPTVVLAKVHHFDGFRLTPSLVHADADYIKVWIRDGSAPSQTNVYFYGLFPKDVQYIDIPCDGRSDMYVKVSGADRWGIEQDTVTSASIDLGDCAIPGTDTGVVFVSSVLSGYPTSGYSLRVTSAHASVVSLNVYVADGGAPTPTDDYFVGNYPWDGLGNNNIEIPWPFGGEVGFAVVGVDAYGIEQANYNTDSSSAEEAVNVYVVAKDGAKYTNVEDALGAIVVDGPTRAEVHVMPGTYSGNTTLPALANDKAVVVRGFGEVILDGVLDLSSAPGITAGVEPYKMGGENWLFQMHNIQILGKVTRTKQSPAGATIWPIRFKGCSLIFDGHPTTDPLLDLAEEAGGAGEYLAILFEDCLLYDDEVKTRMIYLNDGGGANTDISFMFLNCTIACDKATNLFEFDSLPAYPSGADVAVFDGCRLQNKVGATGYIWAGLYSGGIHITTVNNTVYIGAGTVSAGGITLETGRTLAGVATDSNVLWDYAFLETNA